MEFVGTSLALVATFLVYFGFFWKINWIRDLSDLRSKDSRKSRKRQLGKLPPVYPNGWFSLLESRDLRQNQVKHVSALGENFAVFRSSCGKIHILNAYCPHLGANMAEGGKVVGNCLVCPFHSWEFDGRTGNCSRISYAKNVPSGTKTKVWPSHEVNGFIFVWYHAESAEPYWWPVSLEKIQDKSLVYQGRNEFYVNCHIQEIPENGADWAHLNSVHGPNVFGEKFLSSVLRHNWSNTFWSTKKSEDDENSNELNFSATNKHVANMRLRHNLVLLDKFFGVQLDVKGDQIGPGYVEMALATPFGTIYVLQTVTPIEPMVQRVIHTVYASRWASPYAKFVLIGECLQFQRDVDIWNHKKFVDSPVLVAEDRTIKAYRRWYSQFYSQNSPTYESCVSSNSLDW